jgi:hypothetical protein
MVQSWWQRPFPTFRAEPYPNVLVSVMWTYMGTARACEGVYCAMPCLRARKLVQGLRVTRTTRTHQKQSFTNTLYNKVQWLRVLSCYTFLQTLAAVKWF